MNSDFRPKPSPIGHPLTVPRSGWFIGQMQMTAIVTNTGNGHYRPRAN